jgi:hypothetical protein
MPKLQPSQYKRFAVNCQDRLCEISLFDQNYPLRAKYDGRTAIGGGSASPANGRRFAACHLQSQAISVTKNLTKYSDDPCISRADVV